MGNSNGSDCARAGWKTRYYFSGRANWRVGLKTSQEVLDLLIQLNREEGCTVVLITHDEQIAAQCPRVIKMHDGLIVP